MLVKLRMATSKNFTVLAFLFLILSYFLLGFYQSSTNSITTDEIAHLGAAQAFSQGEGLNTEHPPIQKFFNSIVITVFFPNFEEGEAINQYPRGESFYTESKYKPSDILFLSRISYLVFNSIIFFWLMVYSLYFKLLEPKVSLIFASLYLFSPSFYSHNQLITFDVGAATTSLMFLVTFFIVARNYLSFSLKHKFIHISVLTFFLFLALGTKFSNLILLPIFIGVCLFSILIFLLSKQFKKALEISFFSVFSLIFAFLGVGSVYLRAYGKTEYNLKPIPALIEKSKLAANYYEFNGYLERENPGLWKASQPVLRYFDGAMETLSRSNDIQEPYLFGEYRLVSYIQYVSQILWFKENPGLFILGISWIFYFLNKVFRNLGKYLELLKQYFLEFKNNTLNFIKNHKTWATIVALGPILLFPVGYVIIAKDSYLVIGYRHFYSVLILIYFLVATLVSKINFTPKIFDFNLGSETKKYFFTRNYFCILLVLIYTSFGVFGASQSLSYVNFFWSKSKIELANDSTINWAQNHSYPFKYLHDNGLITEENSDKIGIHIFGIALPIEKLVELACGQKYPKLDDRNRYNFDLGKIDIRNSNWEYFVADSEFFQKSQKISKNSALAKENYNYISSLKPIYSHNDIIFVYELK